MTKTNFDLKKETKRFASVVNVILYPVRDELKIFKDIIRNAEKSVTSNETELIYSINIKNELNFALHFPHDFTSPVTSLEICQIAQSLLDSIFNYFKEVVRSTKNGH